MIINASKNVPLQHVPYFVRQNTDERIETLSQMRGKSQPQNSIDTPLRLDKHTV